MLFCVCLFFVAEEPQPAILFLVCLQSCCFFGQSVATKDFTMLPHMWLQASAPARGDS